MKVPPNPPRTTYYISELMKDVFLSKYQLNLTSPKRLSSSSESGYYDNEGSGSSDDGREDDFVDVHEIHLDDNMEPWWLDLA